MVPAKTHILLVEDDLDIQAAMQEVLHEEGFVVTVANNGQEALDILQSTRPLPTSILLDLMMPVMNGLEFRIRMMDDATYACIPVVVVSADRSAHDKLSQMNVAAFLPKPLNLDELLDTLDAVIKRQAGAALPKTC